MWPAALGLVPAAASAADATIKGTVAGPGIPDQGEGVATIQAINAETGVVGGADYTSGKRDSWSLATDPGPYAMGATTVPFGGGKLVEKLLAFVDARSGKTETVKLKLKKKRRHHHSSAARSHARVAEGFGDVDVGYPAIWVHEFDVQSSNPDFGVLRKGIADMLITDIVLGLPAGCDAVVVERARIQDILDEQKLQQLPGFDQSTTVRPGRLIRDNAGVTGTLTESGGQMTISATYTDRRHGRSKTVTVQGPAASFFDLEQQLAQKLIDEICSDELPDTYEGTFSGSSVLSEMTATWDGTATFKRLTPSDPNFGACNGSGVACYGVTGGSVTWHISTSPGATYCQYNTAPQTTAIQPGYGSLSVEASGADSPGYGGALSASDTAPGTVQCPPDPPAQTQLYLFDCCFVTNDGGSPWGDFALDDGWHLQGTRTEQSKTYNWDFTGQ
jgi:hypothetical protein